MSKLDWIGWAITGKELVAMDDLERLGICYWRGLRIEFERRGKQRTAEPHEYAALHNYLWLQPTMEQVSLLSKVRFLGSTFMPLGPAARREFERFRNEVEAREQRARDLIEERKRLEKEAKELAEARKALAEARASEAKAAAAELAKARAKLRTALAAYRKDQKLEIASGPFAGMLATFGRMVQAAHDLFPQIEAEIEIFGRPTSVRIDPLSVRAAE